MHSLWSRWCIPGTLGFRKGWFCGRGSHGPTNFFLVPLHFWDQISITKKVLVQSERKVVFATQSKRFYEILHFFYIFYWRRRRRCSRAKRADAVGDGVIFFFTWFVSRGSDMFTQKGSELPQFSSNLSQILHQPSLTKCREVVFGFILIV